MHKNAWISAVAATGLLAAGSAAPALAAAGNAPSGSTTSSPAEQHRMGSENGLQNMGQMHKQMAQDMPDMGQMHKHMMQHMPEMATMHMQMMDGHSGDKTTSDDNGDER